MLVQIVKHEGKIKRVKPRERPVIELHLEPYQYVVSIELKEAFQSTFSQRKTQDWDWSLFVVTPLGEEATDAPA